MSDQKGPNAIDDLTAQKIKITLKEWANICQRSGMSQSMFYDTLAYGLAICENMPELTSHIEDRRKNPAVIMGALNENS